MSKRKKYPRLLADLRLRALQCAERQAEHRGRDNVMPAGRLEEWWGQGVGADHLWEARDDLPEGQDFNLWCIELAEVDHRKLTWVGSGMPVFRVDTNTLHALANTNVNGVRTTDVRWPYETQLIYLEPPGLRNRCRYVWVHRVSFEEVTASKMDSEHCPRGVRVRVTMHDKHGDYVGYAQMIDWRDETLGEMKAALLDEDVTARKGREGGLPPDEQGRILDTVISLSLYMQQRPPRRASVPDSKVTIRTERLGFDLPREWVVIPAKIDRAPSAEAGSSRLHASPRAHVVRGHWRMQAWGPNNSQRRPLWIKPHWRGEFEPGITKDMHT